jgi:branched-chain amino acid transport system ATP-binding protein
MKVLEAVRVSKNFGGVEALSALDIEVNEGEIVSLIGPNGAGKTTFFNVVTGVYAPSDGSIAFRGQRLIGRTDGFSLLQRRKNTPPYRVARAGIARTFQNIRLFPDMTVLENVQVGADSHLRYGLGSTLLGLPRQRRQEHTSLQEAKELLAFVGIDRYATAVAKNLAYGDQRRLEIARALGTRPSLLLLDEPAAGMNSSESKALVELIERVRAAGTTVLLIEHEMRVVMDLSDRIVVLDFGRKIAEGTPNEIRHNPRVVEAYLGRSTAEQSPPRPRRSQTSSHTPALLLDAIHVRYGAIEAVKGVDLVVQPGEIVTLIGSNGAGKTTILKAISGLKRVSAGRIELLGESITKAPPHRIVERGVAHVPEGRRVFADLSVTENLHLAFRSEGRGRSTSRSRQDRISEIFELFPILADRANVAAGALSGGQQQMLAIGRALMAQPSLLMLDEPSMGLAPILVEKIFDLIKEINSRGTTILLIEQNAEMALRVADRGYVLASGQIALHGDAPSLLENDDVRRAYLGGQ